jgi:hypothetical protein
MEFLFYVEESGPLLWSSGQSSWLQILKSGFEFRSYQIFWEVVGLERGPLSLVSTIEELLQRNSSETGLDILEYGSRDPSYWPSDTVYPQKLTLTSPTNGCRSVGIVRSRTQATELLHKYNIERTMRLPRARWNTATNSYGFDATQTLAGRN